MADHDLFGGDLARHTSFTHQFVILVEQLLERKAAHALYKRCIGFYVQAEIEEGFFAPRSSLAADACDHIE